jgi:hypothetical protein
MLSAMQQQVLIQMRSILLLGALHLICAYQTISASSDGRLAPLPESVNMHALSPELMPPLGIKHAHFAAANKPLGEKECEAHRAGMHPNDLKQLDYIDVAPSPPEGTGPQLMCLSYTYQPAHATKGLAIASTWMTRCDGAVVASNYSDAKLPSLMIPHNGDETDLNLWQKTRANFQYLHDNFITKYDFFVFGGDDYYIVVDNLREYLASEEIQEKDRRGVPLYLGRRFAAGGNMNNIFNSGGPSYILNRAALAVQVIVQRRFVLIVVIGTVGVVGAAAAAAAAARVLFSCSGCNYLIITTLIR